MKKLVLENFGRFRDTLSEALGSEDYGDEGMLELQQLQESISMVKEDLETSVLDYMLYYVLIRSESSEKMQYKVLIDLLDTLINTKQRVASANRKNRPESSSPEKLKMRNPQKAGSSKKAKEKSSDEDDGYSDELIANDSDEGDDGTKGLIQVKKTTVDKNDSSDKMKDRKGKNDADDEDEYANDNDQFEESPRQKGSRIGG